MHDGFASVRGLLSICMVQLVAASPPRRRGRQACRVVNRLVMTSTAVNKSFASGTGAPMAVLCIAFALRFVPEPTGLLPFVVLSVLALAGPGPSLMALAGAWVLSSLNPALIPDSDGAAAGRYLVFAMVLLGAAVRWLSDWPRGIYVSRPVGATALLTGFLILHSVSVSSLPTISLAKALLWGVTMCAVLSSWHRLTTAEHANVLEAINRIMQAVVLTSAPLLFVSDGFALNETGFQGLLNHPQVFGLVAALVAALSASRVLSARRLLGWESALFVVSVYLVLRSESRTALLGSVLGLGAAAVVQGVRRGSIRAAMPLFASTARALSIAICVIALVVVGVATGTVQHFISKSGRADVSNVVEAYEVSRGLLIVQMTENIQRNPLFGIGFGAPSVSGMLDISLDPYFRVPITAPVEKGVLPVAVVEELGVVGAASVLGWLWIGLRRAARSGLSSMAVLFSVLALNVGEAALFSPGGIGLLQMLLIGAVYTSRGQEEGARVGGQGFDRQKAV